ncbi:MULTISPECIES: transposase [Enterobacter]|uniref:transposase n=1 Tax=Enterobacter TaxID=547 RepID=UPI000F0BC990|nr:MULTISPECIES: transposase [Enterobacter]AYU96069.1 transposase [Enterobacter cloacae]MCG7801108.1 transposase [Enterobacter asburiae]UAN16568.1 transposase [Enterobacter asburiae]UAN21464.1 transposase [Enterobacter sp. JBIWA003]UAN31189.1 transposase [Enterobacter sp. JBIWA005]
MELTDYCPRQGLFVEQVREWQIISIKAYKMKLTENRRADKELRDIRSRLRELGKELTRKDKALAEAAALRMLQEKFNALWDNSDEG